MRKWINILTESTAKPLSEGIVDNLPEQPTKKTYTLYVNGKPEFSMEDYDVLEKIAVEYKLDFPTADTEIKEKKVPRDTTYEGHIVETIRKVDGGWRLVSKKGKNLGTYPTKGGAENREREVQYFKHANEDTENLSEIVWLDENLHKWFKEKWVRFGPDGKIRGDCARGSDSEGKPKCLPQSKAHSLGKKGRASAASKKRREDPNPERSGKAKNVATKPSRKVDEAGSPAQQAAIAINMKKAGKKPKQGVAEGLEHNGISFQVQKGKNKFATTLSVGSNPVGVYQYDANTGRSIAEVYPEFKGKGLGKLLVLHAIYTAAELGLDFVEDESRTSEYDNVLDSLSSNGYIVDDDGYWYVTGKGEQFLKQSLKQGVAEGSENNLNPDNIAALLRSQSSYGDGQDGDILMHATTHLVKKLKYDRQKAVNLIYKTPLGNQIVQAYHELRRQGVAEDQLNELKCWPGYHRVKGTKAGTPGSCAKNATNESVIKLYCPDCGGPLFEETTITEKKDACYYKVKSRYKVWPSAYASGALVKCRKKGAKNWGKSKK